MCLLGVLSGCYGLEGNGNRVTEPRWVREVTHVYNQSPFDVHVSQGNSFEVRVRIDSNLQQVVETEVEGHALIISTEADFADIPAGPHVLITMPRIDLLRNSDSGAVFTSWFEQDEQVSLGVSSSGDLSFEGAVSRIKADVQSSGNLHLSGSTDFAELAIDGLGDIDANDLVAAAADVSVTGSGDLFLTVDGPVDARVDGTGDIELSGDVERGRFSESGRGRIQVR
jgi:hypothetical protein